MENFKNFRLSDDAKVEVEKCFRETYLNSTDVFKQLCEAQETLLLVQLQKENTINVDSIVGVLGQYKELIEACLVDD